MTGYPYLTTIEGPFYEKYYLNIFLFIVFCMYNASAIFYSKTTIVYLNNFQTA